MRDATLAPHARAVPPSPRRTPRPRLPAPLLRARRAPATRYAPRMRSKRSWAWAGLGASSLLAFLAACGSVNETFTINVNTLDAGSDSGPAPSDATVADGSTPDASSDAASDATVPDGSVQDAQVDAARDAGSGPVVPDGGSVVIVGDAAVVIPPLDPALLGGADGGIVLNDGGLANADGGALTPQQFRDFVNSIACNRASECCCPGCSESESASAFSKSKCATGLGSVGLQSILTGNEAIPAARVAVNAQALAQCVSLLNGTLSSCRSLSATAVASLRSVCQRAFESSNGIGAACSNVFDCSGNARCRPNDGGANVCQPLLGLGDPCVGNSDCSARVVSGNPPRYCAPADAGATCQPYKQTDEACSSSIECGAGACTARQDGSRRCSDSLPFAAVGDPASFCTSFSP